MKKKVNEERFFVPLKLNYFPNMDKNKEKELIIQAKKSVNDLLKESKNEARLDKCYYCGKNCDSFCNSHTVPAFCLKNIAKEGKVYYNNSILDLPVLSEDKGVNRAGTFQLICRECDSKIFQEYENPDNYESIPTVKMVAQIDMKNNLKNISKRLMEIPLYDLMAEKWMLDERVHHDKKEVSDMDLKEFEYAYKHAKKCASKPMEGEYYIGFYKELPYVVPVAFQGTMALTYDLEGNVINNIYDYDPKYKIKNLSLCIFPLKDKSIIMLFVEKGNRRYGDFFKQFKKLGSLEKQLSIINYILFAYTEDFFLSPDLKKETLEELNEVAGKSTEFFSFFQGGNQKKMEMVQEIYNYEEATQIPNLLLKKYKVN